MQWMRSSRVVRESDCQCQSRNSPRLDPSILRQSGIRGPADEALFYLVYKKFQKISPVSNPIKEDGVGHGLSLYSTSFFKDQLAYVNSQLLYCTHLYTVLKFRVLFKETRAFTLVSIVLKPNS